MHLTISLGYDHFMQFLIKLQIMLSSVLAAWSGQSVECIQIAFKMIESNPCVHMLLRIQLNGWQSQLKSMAKLVIIELTSGEYKLWIENSWYRVGAITVAHCSVSIEHFNCAFKIAYDPFNWIVQHVLEFPRHFMHIRNEAKKMHTYTHTHTVPAHKKVFRRKKEKHAIQFEWIEKWMHL